MKRNIRLVWLLAGALWVAGAAPPQKQLIVETNSSDDISRISSRYGVNVVQTIREKENNIYVVAVSHGSSKKTAAAIQADPSVKSVASDDDVELPEDSHGGFPVATALDPMGPSLLLTTSQSYFGNQVRSGYVQQTGMNLIQLAQAQQQFPTGNTIVAVIDTGVDPTHPALANVLVPGFDFIHNTAGLASELTDLSQSTVAILDQSTVAILDRKRYPVRLNQSTVAILDQSTVAILDGQLPQAFGHGTMVSGLVHLVAPTALIMPLKAFSSDGTAEISNIVAAIYYAVDNGAKVINMSFSTPSPPAVLQQAINYASSHGVISVAAAGNDGKRMTVYPAGYRGVISVESTNKNDLRSMFSNYSGSESIHLAAPGEALMTTYPGNNYAAVWGTSFSAALVSGASALVTDMVPLATPSYSQYAFDQGTVVGHQEEGGTVRLDLLPTLQYCLQQPNPTRVDE